MFVDSEPNRCAATVGSARRSAPPHIVRLELQIPRMLFGCVLDYAEYCHSSGSGALRRALPTKGASRLKGISGGYVEWVV